MMFATMITLAALTQSPSREEALAKIENGVEQGPFKPDWESLEKFKTPEWYQDAKFGIFIHWGAYSVPAFGSEWYPRQMYQKDSAEFKHHVATFGEQKDFGYKDFIPRFKAEHFDANAWAKLFKDSGAKLVVPVAEHHDGFPMYDTQWSDWSAAKIGPKRDVIGELSKSVREQGLIFGVSSHRAEHWWFFNGGRAFDSDVQDPRYAGLYGPAQPEKATPDKAFLDDWLLRTSELVDKYHPQLVWFDWWIGESPAFQPYLKEFASYYYNQGAQWRKGVAINYKNTAYAPKSAVLDLERGQLAATRPLFWQTDTSVSKNSWGHIEGQDYKDAHSIIGDLIDIVSKNGALLLNIGPRADGTIPDEEQTILLDIGKWLKVNGDAIYGTRPFRVFGEGPTHVGGGMFTDTNRQEFTPKDFRFTVKGKKVYAICLAWPGEEAVIKSLGSDAELVDGSVTKVELLGHSGELKFEQKADGLHVALPAEKPCDHAFCFRIEGLKNVAFDQRVRQANDGSFVLSPGTAELHGGKLQVEQQQGRDDIGYWDDPSGWVSWQIECKQPGTYLVSADLAANGDSELEVRIGDTARKVQAPKTGSWGSFATVACGSFELPRAGVYTVSVHPASRDHWKPVNLAQIRLSR